MALNRAGRGRGFCPPANRNQEGTGRQKPRALPASVSQLLSKGPAGSRASVSQAVSPGSILPVVEVEWVRCRYPPLEVPAAGHFLLWQGQ